MRFLLLTGLLAACSTDTFVGDDGGATDAATTDAPLNSESGKSDAGPAFDPSQLGSSLALWLDAADAKTALDASDLVAAWPDHQNKYVTRINVGSSTACTGSGIHTGKAGTINNHTIVTFCNAILEIADAASLHFGTSPFFIEAVMAPPQTNSSNGDVLFTKTQTGDSNPLPSYFTILTPNSNGRMQGWLNGNASAFSQNTLPQEYQYVGFVRTSTAIYVRVNGQAATSATVNASDDVSNVGSDIGIGGYGFDQVGQVHQIFRGEFVELVAVTDTGRIADVEFYFKNKYSL
jgi:hypothetical protein